MGLPTLLPLLPTKCPLQTHLWIQQMGMDHSSLYIIQVCVVFQGLQITYDPVRRKNEIKEYTLYILVRVERKIFSQKYYIHKSFGMYLKALFFLFMWVLKPCKVYITFVKLIIKTKWAKTGALGAKNTQPSVSRHWLLVLC